jgi:hypothetical protein
VAVVLTSGVVKLSSEYGADREMGDFCALELTGFLARAAQIAEDCEQGCRGAPNGSAHVDMGNQRT